MTHDGIIVDHARLQGASDDLATAAQTIRARLDDLENDLAPLASRWSGQAQGSYAAAKAKWDTAMTEMNLLLQDISVVVSDSNQAYRDADRRGAQRFS